MHIVKLNKDLEPEYERFVEKHAFSVFYYTLAYRDIIIKLLKCEDEYHVLIDKDEVRAILPILSKTGKFGKVFNSLPYYGAHGAILAENEYYYQALLKKYDELTKTVAASCYIENPLFRDALKPEHDYVSERVCLINTIKDLDSEELLMQSFESVRRRNVRKAIKENIQVRIDNSPDSLRFLYETHKINMEAIGGKVKEWDFFDSIDQFFTKNKDYNLYIAELNGKKIAALLLFYFNKSTEYYTPVIVEEYRNMQPLAIMVFRAMQDSVVRGFNYWNWGGNGIGLNSVYQFKKKWGAEDYLYNYYIKINNRAILDASPEELSGEYDNFFVVPFDKLNKG